MAHIYKKQAKQILEVINTRTPPPTQGDIDLATAAALTCKSSKDFCEFLDIDAVRFNYWCKNYPSYRKAVWAWRDVATSEIEVAMAKRAIGFKKTTRRDVVTKTGQVETLINETYYPPDPTAAQFWLKNRAPNDWQDKKEIDVNVNANIRAWLVAAGGQLDPSETIDISPGSDVANSLITNEIATLTNDQINNIIENEINEEANAIARAEEALISDLIAEVQADAPTVEPENNSPVNPAPMPGPQWSNLNGKWT